MVSNWDVDYSSFLETVSEMDYQLISNELSDILKYEWGLSFQSNQQLPPECFSDLTGLKPKIIQVHPQHQIKCEGS